MNLSSKGDCMIHIRQSMQNTLQIRAAESCCKVVVVTLLALIVFELVVAGAVVRQLACRARLFREGTATIHQARLRVLQDGIMVPVKVLATSLRRVRP